MCKTSRRPLTSSYYLQIFLAFLAFSHCMINISAVSCGGHQNGTSGRIKTPNYPQNYPSQADCSWSISVPKGYIIRLSFEAFLTERNFGCNSDYVKVFDGRDDKANPLGKYCGGMHPFDVVSTSNHLAIRFISDQWVSFYGFKAKYVAIQQGISTPSAASILPITTLWLENSSTERPATTTLPTTASTSKPTTLRTVKTIKFTTTLQTTTKKYFSTEPPIAIKFVRPFQNATITISAGDSYKFVCQVRGTRQEVLMFWTKDDFKLKPIKRRIRIVMKRHRRKTTLNIKKTTVKDNGVYGCHAVDNLGRHISMYAKLKVEIQQAPTPTPTPVLAFKIAPYPKLTKALVTKSKLNTTAEMGENVVLWCMYTGSPPISMRWMIDGQYRNGTQIYHDKGLHSSSYRIVVSKEYTLVKCEARNPYGISVGLGVVRLKSQEPKGNPAVITIATLNLTAEEKGQEMILRCSASGSPPLVLRWIIGKRYHQTSPRSRGNFHTSSYKLKVEKDSTTVKCQAQNQFGIDTKTGVITLRPSVGARQASPWDSFKPGRNMFYTMLACGAAIMVLVLIGIVCFRKTSNNKYRVPTPVSLEQLTKNPIFEKNSNTYVDPRLEKWDVHRNNVEFIKDIEDGSFSRIFLGRMTHASRGEQDALVHVKVLKESPPSDVNKEAFEEEALELITYDHPNVQRLEGVCMVGRPLFLVFECLDRGDLNQFLRDSGCSHYIIRERPNSSMDPDTKLSKLDQLGIAKQIASGMQYLSYRGYQHRQLSTKNCLISKNMVVKVGNIGTHHSRPHSAYSSLSVIEKTKYPVRWLPLESVMSGKFSDNTDIWSFGIVLWEIYSYGMTPYYGMNNDEVISLVREGDILPRPKDSPKEMYDLMQDCWNLVPHERPSFRFLHGKISALLTGVAV